MPELTPSAQVRFDLHRHLAAKAARVAARKRWFRRDDFDIAENAALVGLWQAAQKFDAARNHAGEAGFVPYAAVQCRRSIIDWLQAEKKRRHPWQVAASLDALLDGDEPLPLLDHREPEVGTALEAADLVETLLDRVSQIVSAKKASVIRTLVATGSQTMVAALVGLKRARVSQIVSECLPLLARAAKEMP